MTTASYEAVTLPKIMQRLPKVLKKLPTVTQGLMYANDRRKSKNMGLGWAFARAVKANPNGAAVKYLDYQLTYWQLDQWSNQLAHYLLSQGIKKGDVICIGLENRPEFLCACLAAAKVGAVLALINTSQMGKVLTHSINLVEPKLAIVGAEMFDTFKEVMSDTSLAPSDYLWWDDTDTYRADINEQDAPQGFDNLAALIKDQPTHTPSTSEHVYYDDGLYYIYTSGTTGLPKAVVFTHGRWMRAYGNFGYIFNLDEQDTLYVTLPLYHATGIVICWSSTLAGNAALAIRRKFSTSNFWSDIHHFNATSFGYVGELCRYLLDGDVSSYEQNNPVTKIIGNGLRPNIWHEFKTRFDIDEILEFYASSEGNIGFSNVFNFENTVGFSPMPYILVEYDKEKGQPVTDAQGFMQEVAVGEVGLLLGEITPKTPFDGYTDKEKTKSVVLENVLKQGDKYFNSGDLMRNIGFKHCQFVDRLGDTFRWKGENVSTTEVENIMSDFEGISEAIVYGVTIQGTDGRAGMAAITLVDGVDFDSDLNQRLMAYLKAELPHYAIPVFIRLQSQVELTGTFKYSKTKLKQVGFDPAQTDDPLYVYLSSEDSTGYTAIDATVYDQIQSGHYRL